MIAHRVGKERIWYLHKPNMGGEGVLEISWVERSREENQLKIFHKNMTKNPKELIQLLVADSTNSDSFVSQIWGGRYAKEIQDFGGDNGWILKQIVLIDTTEFDLNSKWNAYIGRERIDLTEEENTRLVICVIPYGTEVDMRSHENILPLLE